MKKSNKKLKAAIRLVLTALAAAVIGVNVYALNASMLTGDSVPMPFGVGAAGFVSGSMEPELSVGDLIIVKERDAYEVGDVIVYQDGRMSVAHRIVAMDEETVTAKGDANNTNDSPITPAQIKGEVVTAVPLVGYLVNAVKTPLGTLCILVLAVLLLERSFRIDKQKDADELNAIRAEIEKLKQENNHI
jgi:signal peptidase